MDLNTGESRTIERRHELLAAEFLPDGVSAISVDSDGAVRLWELNSGRSLWRAPLLLSSPPRLLTHEGWRNLENGDDDVSFSKQTTWRSRVIAHLR